MIFTSWCFLVSLDCSTPITRSLRHVHSIGHHLLISLKTLSTYVPFHDFVGCLEDTASNGQPLLYGPTAKKETQESCKDFCTASSGGPYRYFGIKDGFDCHCGNTFLHSAVKHPGECNTGCSGNASQQCGGITNRMSLWETSNWPLVRVFSYKLAVPLFGRRIIPPSQSEERSYGVSQLHLHWKSTSLSIFDHANAYFSCREVALFQITGLTNLEVGQRSITPPQTLETVSMAILGMYRIIQALSDRPNHHMVLTVHHRKWEMVWTVTPLRTTMMIAQSISLDTIQNIPLDITRNSPLRILRSNPQNHRILKQCQCTARNLRLLFSLLRLSNCPMVDPTIHTQMWRTQ
jgi:hypothetical protein